jgi:hypothetical protein
MLSYLSDGMPSQFNYLKEPGVNGLITDRDYHWEDGWELLWMNIGKSPNGDPYSASAPLGLPSVRTLLRRLVATLRPLTKLTI